MTNCDHQLRCFEQMAALLERMLQLTHNQSWAALAPLEAQFNELSEQVRGCEDCAARDEAWRQRSAQLHATIQTNHQALRALVMPELARLATALRSMEWQQSLQNAYSRPDHALL